MKVRDIMRVTMVMAAFCMAVVTAYSQHYAGEVMGTLGGQALKYHGDYTDDLWGLGGTASIHFAPHSRLAIEARFGLAEIRWKVTPSELFANPDYFGQGAQIGDRYPGTATTIEPENESRITTGDLLLQYVLVPDLEAVPFIYAGVGLLSFSPTNSEEHEALPNNTFSVYDRLAASVPVGGGVRIPFSYRVGLQLRAEHRFVFSQWLDDVNTNGANDGLTSFQLGLTYRFTNEPDEEIWVTVVCECCGETWLERPGHPVAHDCLHWHHCDGCGHWHCCKGVSHCDGCCCCCCCGGGSGGSGSGGGGGSGQGEGGGGGDQAGAEPAARKAFSKDIRFKLDTDEFDFTYPQTRKNLDELLDYMAKAPEGHEVIIEGHASGEGPPKRNKELSDLRSKKIREWLIQQGVDASKIKGTVGYGSSVPKIKEPTPEQMKTMTKEEIEAVRAQNRRIEIHVLKDAYAQDAQQ
jgi:outer membrane protein OmpA-like peptidoglycan-associated protein/uncharacterized membrane protein YgcG